MKKIIAVCVILSMLCCMCLPASAAVPDLITPYWENASTVRVSLDFDGSTGSVYCKVMGKSGTTNIEGTLTLYEDGVESESWDMTTASSYKIVSDTVTGVKGSTYKLVLDIKVKTNGVWEDIEDEISAVCS